MIRAEVQSVIQEEFDKSKLKSVASAIVAKAQPLANQVVDKVQTDLENYGSSDAGVFNIIPESTRQKTAGLVSALDPALNKVIDSAQSTANQKVDD